MGKKPTPIRTRREQVVQTGRRPASSGVLILNLLLHLPGIVSGDSVKWLSADSSVYQNDMDIKDLNIRREPASSQDVALPMKQG